MALLIEETTNQMLVFSERGKPEYPGKNLSQTQPIYDGGGNGTRATLVEGECSHHCANPALSVTLFIYVA